MPMKLFSIKIGWYRKYRRESRNYIDIVLAVILVKFFCRNIWKKLSPSDQDHFNDILFHPFSHIEKFAHQLSHQAMLSDPLHLHWGHTALERLDLLYRLGRWKYPSRIKAKKRLTGIYCRLGCLLKWQGKFDLARLLFLVAIKNERNCVIGYVHLADIYLVLSRWSDQLKVFRDQESYVEPQVIFPFADGIRWFQKIPLESQFYRTFADYLFERSKRCGNTTQLLQYYHGVLRDKLPLHGIDVPFIDPMLELRGEMLYILDQANENNRNELEHRFNLRVDELMKKAETKTRKAATKLTHRIRDSKFVLVEICSFDELCKKMGVEIDLIFPSDTFHYSTTVIFDHKIIERRAVHQLAESRTAIFPEVTDLSYGFFMVKDRYILADSKHLPRMFLRMFCPWLWMHNDRYAIVEIPLERSDFLMDKPYYAFTGIENYYHWVIEVAGQIALFSPKIKNIILGTNRYIKKFQKQIFDEIAHFVPNIWRIFPNAPEPYRMSQALLATHVNSDHRIDPKGITFLRSILNVPGRLPKAGKWIYLTRLDVKHADRKGNLRNEDHVVEIFRKWGFTIIEPSQLSFVEQKELFSDCEILAGQGGAALTNILFCTPETKILILSPWMGTFDLYSELAAAIGCKNYLCIGRVEEITPNPFFLWNNMFWRIDLVDLEIAISRLMEDMNFEAMRNSNDKNHVSLTAPQSPL